MKSKIYIATKDIGDEGAGWRFYFHTKSDAIETICNLYVSYESTICPISLQTDVEFIKNRQKISSLVGSKKYLQAYKLINKLDDSYYVKTEDIDNLNPTGFNFTRYKIPEDKVFEDRIKELIFK